MRVRESLAWRVASRYWKINGPTWAAAMALRILLAIVPMIVLSLVLISLVLDPQTNVSNRVQIARATPAVLRPSVLAEVTTLRDSDGVGVLSFVLLVWTAGGAFGCFESCLAEAYGFAGRTLKRQKLLALAFVVAMALMITVAMLVAAAMEPTTVAGLTRVAARRAHLVNTIVPIALPLVLCMISFASVYHFLPNRKMRWRETLPGTLFAVAGAIALSAIWPVYSHYAGQTSSASHAVLLLLVAVVTYVYLLAEILVVGGVMNAVLLRRRFIAAE